MSSPESFSPIIEMAKASKGKSQEKSRKPEKTQEELRVDFESKLNALKSPIVQGVKDYQQALDEGLFDDRDGELEGAGEKRKEEMQKRLISILDRAEQIKVKLDSGDELPQSQDEIQVVYNHVDPVTHQVERSESITLNIESKLQSFLDFYQKNNINLPSDFVETVRDIWEQNQVEIQQAIEQNGFDDVLIVPPDLSLSDLSEKMKMGNGYYEGSNFTAGGSFAGAVSQNVDRPHIVLVHKTQNLKDRPELSRTLNVKGQDVDMAQILPLEDYLIFQKKYFEETGKHLDEVGWTWLATKSGARLVGSYWDPSRGKLGVSAYALGYRGSNLGARPSRSFFQK